MKSSLQTELWLVKESVVFSFLLMLPSFQDTPLKSLMIRLVETFSKGNGISQQAQIIILVFLEFILLWKKSRRNCRISLFLVYLKMCFYKCNSWMVLPRKKPKQNNPKPICFHLWNENNLGTVTVVCFALVNACAVFLSVSQRDPKPPWLGGRIVEAVSVTGSSPTYNVSWMVSGCGASLPLLSPR